MSAEVLIANLLRVAQEDLHGARLLATAGNRNAVYLCEQAAEKVIQAVLTSEGIHGGIKHQLDQMVDLVPNENPLKPALRAIEKLAAYATTYRYPTATGRIKASPSETALKVEISNVQQAIDLAAQRFGVDMSKPGKPAASSTPVR
jgi:HEPN domain-containing protein